MSEEQPRALKQRRTWLLVLLAAFAAVGVLAAIKYGASTRSVLLFVFLFVALGAAEAGLYEFIRRRLGDNVVLQGLLFLVFTVLLFAVSYFYLF